MMCQHCTNAPCENVCPVNATITPLKGWTDGLHRCVGNTLLCQQPSFQSEKIHRYDYTQTDLFPGNSKMMAGETDTHIMARESNTHGIESRCYCSNEGRNWKCSFCVQRIQNQKTNAKRESRPLMANEVKRPVRTVCPTGAITFGDMNNEK